MEVTRRQVLGGLAGLAATGTRHSRRHAAYAATATAGGGAAMPVLIDGTGVFNGAAPSAGLAAAEGDANDATAGVNRDALAQVAAAIGDALPTGRNLHIPAAGKASFGAYPAASNGAPTTWESMCGRQLDNLVTYPTPGWTNGSAAAAWPYSPYDTYADAGRMIRCHWNGVLSGTPDPAWAGWWQTYSSKNWVLWDAIAAGHWNTIIDAHATTFKAWLDANPSRVLFISPFGEFDAAGAWNAYTTHYADWNTSQAGSSITGPCATECAQFVAAWRLIYNRVMAIETRIIWCWLIAGYMPTTGRQQIIQAMYPGDAYVDWVGAEPYDASASGTATGTYTQSLTFIHDHVTSAKPFMIGETGATVASAGDAAVAAWLNTVPAAMNGISGIPVKMWQYWNSSPYVIAPTNTLSAAALANIGADTVFN